MRRGGTSCQRLSSQGRKDRGEAGGEGGAEGGGEGVGSEVLIDSREAPKKVEEKEPIVCRVCGKEGHIARNCPQ